MIELKQEFKRAERPYERRVISLVVGGALVASWSTATATVPTTDAARACKEKLDEWLAEIEAAKRPEPLTDEELGEAYWLEADEDDRKTRPCYLRAVVKAHDARNAEIAEWDAKNNPTNERAPVFEAKCEFLPGDGVRVHYTDIGEPAIEFYTGDTLHNYVALTPEKARELAEALNPPRPIETAPLDRCVLSYVEGRWRTARYSDPRGAVATHWLPIPPAPKESER